MHHSSPPPHHHQHSLPPSHLNPPARSPRQTWIHAAAIVLSLVFFFVFALVYNAVCLSFPSLAGSYWVIQQATTDSPALYLAAVLAGVTAVLPR